MSKATKTLVFSLTTGITLFAGGFFLSWRDEQSKAETGGHHATTAVHAQDEGLQTASAHANEHAGGNDHKHEHSHGDHGDQGIASEVQPEFSFQNGVFQVVFKDLEGQRVTDFEVLHEKLLHLIIVSSDLNTYRHLHPVHKGEGVFELPVDLQDGMYKAFLDAKPKGRAYQVQPLVFSVGNPKATGAAELVATNDFVITDQGLTVELKPSSLGTDGPVVLDFELSGGAPQPYLGALGHVVILDERAQEFIHVHPRSESETIFETHFVKPGLYKVWAEFKVGDEVRVFPYVLNIE